MRLTDLFFPSQNLCICAQFWRYQHYLLPLWPWGVTKIVCFDLGSFRHVQENGEPFSSDTTFPSSPSGDDNNNDNNDENNTATGNHNNNGSDTNRNGSGNDTTTSKNTDNGSGNNATASDDNTKNNTTKNNTTKNNTHNKDPSESKAQATYREVLRTPALRKQFNARPVSHTDPLQAMLRHVAAIEMASMLKFCGSARGIEHDLIKVWFKKLGILQGVFSNERYKKGAEEDGEGVEAGKGVEDGKGDKVVEMVVKEVDGKGVKKVDGKVVKMEEKVLKKLGKLPVTAGYGGDGDLVDVEVVFCGGGYTKEDREALGRLAGVFRAGHLPPVRVIGQGIEEVCELVDEKTMVYCVDDGGFAVRGLLERRPAAVIWGVRASQEG